MKKLLIIIASVLFPCAVYAACTGTYPNSLDVCGAGTTISNTVHIAGGVYSSLHPFQANAANTEYLLDGDMMANGTGIQITAAPVAINLNGHRITYNNMSTSIGYYGPNGGIVTAAQNLNNGGPATAGIGISNGYIVQASSQTTFASAIDSSQASIPVTNSSVFHIGEYLIAFSSQSDQTVNTEHMLITYIAGNTLTVSRGSDGTTAAVHDNTAVVFSSRGAGLGYEPVASAYGAYGGIGDNAICTKPYILNYTQVDSINATYSGLDVSGFVFGGEHTTVSNCTLTDTMGYGWVTYRGNGVYAVASTGDITAHDNIVVNTRNRGIGGSDHSNVHNNTISVLSVCTNSSAVTFGSNSVMQYNNIIGRGEAAMGIEVGTDGNTVIPHIPANDVTGILIDHNTMDMQVTSLGAEYGGSTYPGPTTLKRAYEWAVGVRSTTGIHNTTISNNTITVRGFDNYSGNYSPTGEPVQLSARAHGIMAGLRWNDESLNVYGNNVTSLDISSDGDPTGSGQASGIDCSANSDNRYAATTYWILDPSFRPALNIYGNTITSNSLNIAIGDDYSWCDGYPAFYDNMLIKSGSFANYASYGTGAGYGEGGWNITSLAWLLGSSYSGGAAESSQSFAFSNLSRSGLADSSMNIIFGDVVSNHAYLRYSESNSGGTTGSATPITTTLNTLSLALPLGNDSSGVTNRVSAGWHGLGFSVQHHCVGSNPCISLSW